MDQPKQHASRADILTFPHMSRKDERLLQTVLNNMSQGVLMFDSETRLIFSNQRYIELYGLSAEIVKPGCPICVIFSSTEPSSEVFQVTSTNTSPGLGTESLKEKPSIRL